MSEYWAITPPMPGPKPRPRRTETEPSTATNGVRPGGEASTRKAVQVPKNAPVARPWIARATSSPVRSGSVIRMTWATARVASAPSSTALRPIRSDTCPRVSIDGTRAAT